jgi:hypothetical protein
MTSSPTSSPRSRGRGAAPKDDDVEQDAGAGQAPAGSGPSTPNVPPPGAPGEETGPVPARLNLQAFLGELHGLLHVLSRTVDRWCSPELREPMQLAIAETHPAFGRAQAHLSTGTFDETFPEVGLAGNSLAMKLGEFRRRLATVYDRLKERAARLVPVLKDAVRWGLVPLETLANEIPGGTAIKEIFLAVNEALADAAEPTDGMPAVVL